LQALNKKLAEELHRKETELANKRSELVIYENKMSK
jgi:hypothetical protein